MKKSLYVLLMALFVLSCSDIPVKSVSSIAGKTKKEVCPDRRVAIWDIDYTQKGKVVTLSGKSNLPEGVDNLTQALSKEGYTVANKIQILPSKELGDKIYGLVSRSVLNIRTKPEFGSAEMATQAILGVPLKIYDVQGSYHYVQTPDGYLGWVLNDNYVAMDEKTFSDWLSAEKIIYLADAGYIYSEPSDKSQIVGDITAKSLMKYLGKKGSYTKVAYPDGRTGYILTENAQNFNSWKNSVSPKLETVLSEAHELIGRSYLWGGTSTKMLDCSGFARTVMFLNGIYLPRDASQQAYVGETTAMGNTETDKIQPGNLIFFGRYRENGDARITHVGIYLGDGKFIHESGTVKIESLNPESEDFNINRFNNFMWSKNVIDHVGELNVQTVAENPLFK